jgi:hypothetical protein
VEIIEGIEILSTEKMVDGHFFDTPKALVIV